MPHQTIEFLKSRRPDSVHAVVQPHDTPKHRTPVPRLAWLFPGERGRTDDEHLATVLEQGSLPDGQFVLDTGFLTGGDVTQRLWEVLFGRRILIPPLVWMELQPWLETPFRNQFIRDQLVLAKENGHANIDFLQPLDETSELDLGIWYYIRLLSFRKMIFPYVEAQLRESLQRAPTSNEVDFRVRRLVQDRGWQLAVKGKDDFEKPNFLADEATVVRAVTLALATGRETTILTRDTDIIEQFYKFIYLLDTHYRSMLIASAYHTQPLNFREQISDEVGPSWSAFDRRSAKFIYRPIGASERVLPPDPHWVMLYCYGLGDIRPPWTLDILSFNAEQEMLETIRMKGRTRGLNTNLFGDFNFHLCVDPSRQDELANISILAKDRFSAETESMRWSVIDVDLAMRRIERGERVKYVATQNQANRSGE